MKKYFIIFFSAFLAATLVACSDSEGSSEDETFELVYANDQEKSHPMNQAGEWMAEELEEQSDGKITMTIQPDGALGGPEDLISSLDSGNVDFAWITSAALSEYSEEFDLFNAAYLFEDEKQYKEHFFERDSEVMEEMDDIIEEANIGSHMVGMLGGGKRHLYNSKQLVENPEDLEGLKMRVQDSEINAASWEAMGTTPTSLPYTEVFTGFQSGVIDAAESSLSAYDSSKFYEEAPYLSLTGHEIIVGPMMMSDNNYEELPEDLQEIVNEVAFEAGKKASEIWWEEEEELVDNLKDEGVEVTEVDVDKFKALAEPVIEETAKNKNAEDLYKKIQD